MGDKERMNDLEVLVLSFLPMVHSPASILGALCSLCPGIANFRVANFAV
jgi:hypothetical protein